MTITQIDKSVTVFELINEMKTLKKSDQLLLRSKKVFKLLR
jgi:hypothetical protein